MLTSTDIGYHLISDNININLPSIRHQLSPNYTKVMNGYSPNRLQNRKSSALYWLQTQSADIKLLTQSCQTIKIINLFNY